MNPLAPRILVVDDDPDIGFMIKTMLEFHGYAVEVTEQAEYAEDMLETGRFDLLIMDMLLSGMNGTDICSRIKQRSNIPIVMISAHPQAREICLSAGADEFIAKPFDMQEMISKLKALLPAS